MLIADEAGSWSLSSNEFLNRHASGRLTGTDLIALRARGHAFETEDDIYYSSFLARWSKRRRVRPVSINYLILVPTLRCNLECGYCQVSRAAENAQGYDWDEVTLAGVLSFIDSLQTPSIKIEFQGGEPLLRLDLLQAVRDFCRKRFERSQFVVCSNFQRVDAAAWEFFDADDTSLSTSFDGTAATHTRQRTKESSETSNLLTNLKVFRGRFGAGRLSALPTIDVFDPPPIAETIETFAQLGLNSIFLRPINWQGFARRETTSNGFAETWLAYHREFVGALVDRNYGSDEVMEEYYLAHAIRRVLQPGADGNVDLRNPNLLGRDYAVVDYDGELYPTDESRMMSRVSQIDLSVGHVDSGLDLQRVDILNTAAFNDLDPDCVHCAFQPYCGTDNIDAVSRHGRADIARHDTWFCQRHLGLFDQAFEMISSTDPKVQHTLKKWLSVDSWPESYSEVLV